MSYDPDKHAILLIDKKYKELLKEYAKRNKRTLKASLEIIIEQFCLETSGQGRMNNESNKSEIFKKETKEYRSYYGNLVLRLGENGAREQMKNIRKKRKVNNGGGFNNPEIVKKAIKARTKD